MGLNGIGVAGFFDLEQSAELITVMGLAITENEIRGCLQKDLPPIPENLFDSMGYGGIALADVDGLSIRENIIEDNGNDLESVSGIFLLHGEGVEVVGNKILHQGAAGELTLGEGGGRCGGINIVYATAPTLCVDTLWERYSLRQNGISALRVYDNVVSVRLGQALSVTALGPVSVRGNQFTTRGIPPRLTAMFREAPLAPAVVAIVNLGVSNELYGQLFLFSALRQGRFRLRDFGIRLIDDILHMPGSLFRELKTSEIGRYLTNGNVVFRDNQCVLDLLESEVSWSISSIYILSLDDVAFHNNQCDCSVLDDFVFTQAVLLSFSIRATSNRFKEGLVGAVFSAVTLGIMNTTANNQATHPLMILPPAALYPYTKDASNTCLLCLPEHVVSRLFDWATRPFTEMAKFIGLGA